MERCESPPRAIVPAGGCGSPPSPARTRLEYPRRWCRRSPPGQLGTCRVCRSRCRWRAVATWSRSGTSGGSQRDRSRCSRSSTCFSGSRRQTSPSLSSARREPARTSSPTCLHEQSARAGGPFVVFDCGAVAANLAESELLGHERGAFTGAVSAHPGAFERAHGGTLFLDEVGELPSTCSRAFCARSRAGRCGGSAARSSAASTSRVIAASNRDLRADVTTGKFREDLFFRLAVAVISVPPFARGSTTCPSWFTACSSDLGRGDLRLAEAALAALRAHPWPGNVRELKNVLACAVAFVDAGAAQLEPHHLKLLRPGERRRVVARWAPARRSGARENRARRYPSDDGAGRRQQDVCGAGARYCRLDALRETEEIRSLEERGSRETRGGRDSSRKRNEIAVAAASRCKVSRKAFSRSNGGGQHDESKQAPLDGGSFLEPRRRDRRGSCGSLVGHGFARFLRRGRSGGDDDRGHDSGPHRGG